VQLPMSHVSPEQEAEQRGRERSWATAQRQLTDPARRAALEAALVDVRAARDRPAITAAEILGRIEPVEQ